LLNVINISDAQTFIKSEYITTDFLKVSLSFDRNDNNVVIIDNLGGMIVGKQAFYIQNGDTIVLYSKENGNILSKYKIVNKNILFDVVNEFYAITLKTYNKKYKDRMLIINKDGSRKMARINRRMISGYNFTVLSRDEALKRFGIDGIHGAIILR
jgi:hypothetical protein